MNIYEVTKPLLFQLNPETVHHLSHRLLQTIQGTRLEEVIRTRYTVLNPRLEVSAFGQQFPNPIGVAAGFDKNAEIPTALAALGFGHVEVGGVTAEPQAGNPPPRLFRLTDDHALINRMGFNNDGADIIGDRLAATDCPVPLGVNIGKSKATPNDEAAADYRYTFERVRDGGDYFVVNVSSPNTPGLRDLQQREKLERILETLQAAGAAPLLVKLSPDLIPSAAEAALTVVEELDLDGVIATNTTEARPSSLTSKHADQPGGLSGAPIEETATEMVRFVAERTDKPVVGVGGISDPEGAYEKIRNGASVVQLYTGLIYRGPHLARELNEGLLQLLDRDGFDSIEAAIGVDL